MPAGRRPFIGGLPQDFHAFGAPHAETALAFRSDHCKGGGDAVLAGQEADREGKESLEEWLRRFVEVGLQIYPDEVVLKGFPWKQTVCVRGRDHLDAPSGERVYENRYVIWGRLRWGLLREYEVYEDTQRTVALDEYLARAE